MPAMRSAYIERFEDGPAATTYFAHEEYLDRSLLDPSNYRLTERAAMLREVLRGNFTVLAVPEPFWIAELPYTTALALAARFAGIRRRRRIDVVTYAIENADAGGLLGLPKWVPRGLRRLALSIATFPVVVCTSRFAFGTQDARSTYLGGVLGWTRRLIQGRSRTFLPLSPRCRCGSTDAKEPVALFLGPLATRKGIDTLLRAWPLVGVTAERARLVVCGTGALQELVDAACENDDSITQVRDASRTQIHALLRSSSVVVSLPRPERRWKEQIGLSIPEGIAHGCHIVTTRQTGLSQWLDGQSQAVVDVDATPAVVADALAQALRQPRPVPVDQLPTISGRARAEWWMSQLEEN